MACVGTIQYIRTIIVPLVFLFFVCLGPLLAQPSANIPPSQLGYFQYLFTSIGDPARPQDLQDRLEMYSERLKLNPVEEAALKEAVAAFQASLITFRQQNITVLRAKAPGSALTETENRTARAFLATHQARITQLGNGFLTAVRPETARKIRLAIERKPY